MEIAKSIQHFLAKADAYEKALLKLQSSARSFFLETFNRPGLKQQKKWRLNHWTKVDKLVDALMPEFFWLTHDERNNGPPHPYGKEPYHEDLLAPMKISVMAKSQIVSLGGKIDDGYPKTTAKTVYHSSVLDVWTELGGKLKFSRHPRTGKIKGPLARYFSAVTQPVHGGSPESLPDIIKRHLAQKAALDKWRLDNFIAKYPP
jgi:hypothetical protein